MKIDINLSKSKCINFRIELLELTYFQHGLETEFENSWMAPDEESPHWECSKTFHFNMITSLYKIVGHQLTSISTFWPLQIAMLATNPIYALLDCNLIGEGVLARSRSYHRKVMTANMARGTKLKYYKTKSIPTESEIVTRTSRNSS